MYDLPEIRAHTDAWWRVIAACLRREGVREVPKSLTRSDHPEAIWRDPALLITQTCGYPLRHGLASTLTAIAAPCFRAPGCLPGEYSSAFVVREDDAAHSLADLQGRRLVANAADSQSGFNCIRDSVIKLRFNGSFFKDIVWSGSHRRSLAAIARGDADLAAIDAVSLRLIQTHAPTEFAGLRILQWSESVPALPYATRTNASPELIARLRAGLHAAVESPDSRETRSALLIDRFIDNNDADYEPIVAMRQRSDVHTSAAHSMAPAAALDMS